MTLPDVETSGSLIFATTYFLLRLVEDPVLLLVFRGFII